MYYLYIIYSETFDKFYIGSSQNPWERLISHNESGFNTFTSKYRPWTLKAVFEIGYKRGDAVRLEKFVKRQKSRRLIIKLIDPNYLPVGQLAELVRVPHLRD